MSPDLRNRLEQYRPYLAVIARARLGTTLREKIDADDLVQETFAAAVAALGDFRGTTEAEFAGWLRQILVSRLLRQLERNHGSAGRDASRECPETSRAADDSSPAGLDALAGDLTTPSRAAQRRECAVLVAAALDRLPPEYRDVLVYRSLEGQSFPVVAERMGRSVGAVTMLWARAVRRFREVYPGEP